MHDWQFWSIMAFLAWILADVTPLYHKKDAAKEHAGYTFVGIVFLIIAIVKGCK